MRTRDRLLIIAAMLALAACGREAEPPAPETAPPAQTAPEPREAVGAQVQLLPTAGNEAGGALAFTRENGDVRVVGTLTGLAPGSVHGFHIHETGDCNAPDASSAGGHFAPAGNPHGNRETPEPHHAGDMPNQTANERGEAEIDVLLDDVELGTGGERDIAGRAVIVHARADDYTTQPAGDAGERIACGVIRVVRLVGGEPVE